MLGILYSLYECQTIDILAARLHWQFKKDNIPILSSYECSNNNIEYSQLMNILEKYPLQTLIYPAFYVYSVYNDFGCGCDC